MKGLGKQIAIAAVAAILVFGVGYALFSDAITIRGTATATGSMNVVIDSATMTANNGGGEDSANTAVTAEDGNSVVLSVPTLLYPGASVTFNVGLKNTGSLGAKVTAITPEGLGEATDDLVITYSGIAVNDVIAGNNGTDDITVTVTWNEASSTTFTAQPFSIVIDFTQQNPA